MNSEETWTKYRNFAGAAIDSADGQARFWLLCYLAYRNPDLFLEALSVLAMEEIERGT